MRHPRILFRALAVFTFSTALTALSTTALSRQSVASKNDNPFEAYFNRLAATPDDAGTASVEVDLEKLQESIGTMTQSEIAVGISVIDRQIDNTSEHQNPWAKRHAVWLLSFIAGRPDGADLLASQIDRLTLMLNDPAHQLTNAAVLALQAISFRQPAVVCPIFEAALDDPNVNNATGIGPVIAVMLLRMVPHDDDVMQHVVKYMRRSDLTETQLLSLIMGINGGTAIPDIFATELVRCLDVPNEHIKSRALVGLARSSPAAKKAAQARIQKMANDPKETAHVRKIAADALKGEITYDPNP
jgi:hypothetical protein